MNRQVNVILALKDKFSAPLLKAADTAKSLDKKTYDGMRRTNKMAKDIHKGFGRGLKSIVKWSKRAAIAVGTISFKKGIDGVVELDNMSRKVKSIAGDKLDLSYIKDQLLDIRGMTGKTFQEIGDSWYNAISASVPIEQSLKAVEKAHKLAVAGFTTDDAAMNLLATTMNTFGLKRDEDMDRIADIFLTTQNRGIILVDEMADLFGQVSPISNALGVSIEEQSAAIALLTQKGMKPTKAITGYGRLLDRFLTKTSDEAASIMESVGLDKNFFTAEYLNEKGFLPAMKELQKAVGDDADLISKLFPNINAKLAAQSILSSIDDFEDIYGEMLNPDEALEKAYQTMERSLPRRWEKLKGKIDKINTKFYAKQSGAIGDALQDAWSWLDENEDRVLGFLDKLNDKIEKLIDKIKKLAKWLWRNRDVVGTVFKILIIVHLIVEAMDRIAGISRNIGHLRETFKGIKDGEILANFSPKKILLIAIAIYAVIKAIRYLRQNWDRIKEEYPNFAALVEKIGEALRGLGEIITEVILPALRWLWDKGKVYLKKFAIVVMKFVDAIIGYLKGLAKVVIGFFKVIAGAILGFFTDDFSLLEEGIQDMGDGILDIVLTTGQALGDEEGISKVEKLKEMIQKPIDWVKTMNEGELETATGRVGARFLEFGSKFKNVLKGAIKIFKQAIFTMIKLAVGGIAVILGLLEGLSTGDFSLAKDGFDMMGEGLADMWLTVDEVMNEGLPDEEKINSKFKEYAEAISEGKSTWETLGEVMEKSSFLDKAAEKFSKFGDWVKRKLKGIADMFLGVLQIFDGLFSIPIGLMTGNFDKVKEGFDDVFEGLKKSVGGFGGVFDDIPFIPKAQEKIEQFITWVQKKVAGLLEIIDGVTDAILGTMMMINGAVSGDLDMIEEGFEIATGGIKKSWGGVKDIIGDTDFLDKAKGKFKEFGDWLEKTFGRVKTLFEGLVGIVKGVFKVVFGVFTGNVEKIKEGFEDIKEGFKTSWRGIGEALEDVPFITKAKEKLDEFKDWLEPKLSEILETVGGFVDMLLGLTMISTGIIIGDLDLIKEGFERTVGGAQTAWEGLGDTVGDVSFIQTAKEKIGEFGEWVQENFSGITTIIEGIFEMVMGTVQVMLGVITGDFDEMRAGAERATNGAKLAWEGFTDSVNNNTPKPDVDDDKVTGFQGLISSVGGAWMKLKNKIESNPIVSSITRVWKDDTHHEGRKAKSNRRIFGKKAGNTYKGTTNWKGGWTYLHERGGEVYDLPDGTRVYPHDRSVAMAYDKGYDEAIAQVGQNQGENNGGSGGNIEIGGLHFYGDINNQGDIDEIGTQIATAVKKALANT